jgi:hypothetical protein
LIGLLTVRTKVYSPVYASGKSVVTHYYCPLILGSPNTDTDKSTQFFYQQQQ